MTRVLWITIFVLVVTLAYASLSRGEEAHFRPPQACYDGKKPVRCCDPPAYIHVVGNHYNCLNGKDFLYPTYVRFPGYPPPPFGWD